MMKGMSILMLVMLIPMAAFAEGEMEYDGLIDDPVAELRSLGVEIAVPTEFSVTGEYPVEDFLLIEFGYKGQSMLLYCGNHPQLPEERVPETAERHNISINGLKAARHAWTTGDTVHVEYLVDISKTKDWPQFIHCTYSIRSDDDIAAVFESIIHSVKSFN